MISIKPNSKALSFLIGLLFFPTQDILALPTQNITISSANFTVELATTPLERAKGLMYREHLNPNAGMLFSYTTPRQIGIWMKNTFIPLDILWINEHHTIFYIHENAQPHSTRIMRPEKSAKYVLEVNAGTVKKLKISTGNIIKFK